MHVYTSYFSFSGTSSFSFQMHVDHEIQNSFYISLVDDEWRIFNIREKLWKLFIEHPFEQNLFLKFHVTFIQSFSPLASIIIHPCLSNHSSSREMKFLESSKMKREKRARYENYAKSFSLYLTILRLSKFMDHFLV